MIPMWIDVIASGSSGNAIVIDDGHTKLMLDAGVPIRDLWNRIHPSQLSGVLVTHEHGDHSSSVNELAMRGVPVYMTERTWVTGGFGKGVHFVIHKERFQVGTWICMPFRVIHDAAEPVGFLCYSEQSREKLAYMTDTGLIKWEFRGLTHLLIECNYQESMIPDDLHPGARARIERSHLSIKDVKEFLKRTDTSQLEEIWLMHVSKGSGDARAFARELEGMIGIPVYI